MLTNSIFVRFEISQIYYSLFETKGSVFWGGLCCNSSTFTCSHCQALLFGVDFLSDKHQSIRPLVSKNFRPKSTM